MSILLLSVTERACTRKAETFKKAIMQSVRVQRISLRANKLLALHLALRANCDLLTRCTVCLYTFQSFRIVCA